MLSGIDHPKRLEVERAPLPDSPDRDLSADPVGGVLPHIRLHPADTGRPCRDHARGPGDSGRGRGAPGRDGSRRISRKPVRPLAVGGRPGRPGRFHLLPGPGAGTTGDGSRAMAWLAVAIALSVRTGLPLSNPTITSVGFVDSDNSRALFENTSKQVLATLEDLSERAIPLEGMKSRLTKVAADFIYGETRRRPTVLTVIEQV